MTGTSLFPSLSFQTRPNNNNNKKSQRKKRKQPLLKYKEWGEINFFIELTMEDREGALTTSLGSLFYTFMSWFENELR